MPTPGRLPPFLKFNVYCVYMKSLISPEIVKFPNPILTSVAAPITEFGEELAEIGDIMLDIMCRNHGCGLAGPQIGLPYRIIVVGHDKKAVFVNPKPLWFGNRTSQLEEGCLSLPGVRVPITRPYKIKFTAQTVTGETKKLCYEGMISRIVQHEIDHLNGILINSKM